MAETSKNTKQMARVVECLSSERLGRYLSLTPSHEPEAAVLPYFTIQATSSLFYPTIQVVEVCLRNRIHLAMANFYSGRSKTIVLPGRSETWYEWVPTRKRTKDNINDAITHARADVHGRKVIPGDIICRMMLGTWVSILEERPDNADKLYFWAGVVKDVFPKATLPKKALLQEIHWANDLRNRLFHHEPLWTGAGVSTMKQACATLKRKHRRLLNILMWMSPDLYRAYALDFQYKKIFKAQTESALEEHKLSKALSAGKLLEKS